MNDQLILTYEDLATRWQCSVSRLRNARAHELPARFQPPGSRLVRFRLCDVLAFEAAYSERRDYGDAAAKPALSDLHAFTAPKRRRRAEPVRH